MKPIQRVYAHDALDQRYMQHHVMYGDSYLMALTNYGAQETVATNATYDPQSIGLGVPVVVNPAYYLSNSFDSPDQAARLKKQAFDEFMNVSKKLLARDTNWEIQPKADDPLTEFYVVNIAFQMGVYYAWPSDQVVVMVINPMIRNAVHTRIPLATWGAFCEGRIEQL